MILFFIFSFTLLDVEEVEYVRLPAPETKDNVGLYCLLQPSTSTPPKATASAPNESSDSAPNSTPAMLPAVCVANTHFLYNSKRGDLKLAQFQRFFNGVAPFCAKVRHATSTAPAASDTTDAADDIPMNAGSAVDAADAADARAHLASLAQASLPPAVVFCGDFNATPDSPLMHFALRGTLPVVALNRRRMDGLDGRAEFPPSFSADFASAASAASAAASARSPFSPLSPSPSSSPLSHASPAAHRSPQSPAVRSVSVPSPAAAAADAADRAFYGGYHARYSGGYHSRHSLNTFEAPVRLHPLDSATCVHHDQVFLLHSPFSHSPKN